MRSINLLLIVLTVASLGLAACGPVPVETRPHPVEVKTTPESAEQNLEAARFRAADEDPFAQSVLTQMQDKNESIVVLPAREFMAAVFPGRHSATLGELGSEPPIRHIRDLSVTHIILLEHRASGSQKHGKVTAIASLLSTDQLTRADAMSFHAEGHRAGLSLPLPYIFLVFPYSDPDVLGSATVKIADVLSSKIARSGIRSPRLTLLTSDNLLDLADKKPSHPRETGSPHSEDPLEKMKSPIGFYSEIMSDARAKGEWIYYNPLAHIQMLLTSIIMAPTMVVVDALVDDEEGRSTTPSKAGKPDPRMTEWQQFGFAMDAISRKDWDAGYRLLEDLVASDDETLRLRTLHLLEEHSELLDAARDSFSEESLKASASVYGPEAIAIEEKRLELYRIVTTPEAYSRARENYSRVFRH